MSTLKLKSFFVDLKLNFRVDLKNVDLNNYTHNKSVINKLLKYTKLTDDQNLLSKEIFF